MGTVRSRQEMSDKQTTVSEVSRHCSNWLDKLATDEERHRVIASLNALYPQPEPESDPQG